MSQGHVEISTRVFMMVFIFSLIMIGAVILWAIMILQEITRSMGWG